MADILPFTPGKFVWALQKDVQWVICKLQDHGGDGLEVHMAHDAGVSDSRRFADRAQAMEHADAIRKLLEKDGWTPVVTD
jgi:hypothetical protein